MRYPTLGSAFCNRMQEILLDTEEEEEAEEMMEVRPV
jgi:hypothetical protein